MRQVTELEVQENFGFQDASVRTEPAHVTEPGKALLPTSAMWGT